MGNASLLELAFLSFERKLSETFLKISNASLEAFVDNSPKLETSLPYSAHGSNWNFGPKGSDALMTANLLNFLVEYTLETKDSRLKEFKFCFKRPGVLGQIVMTRDRFQIIFSDNIEHYSPNETNNFRHAFTYATDGSLNSILLYASWGRVWYLREPWHYEETSFVQPWERYIKENGCADVPFPEDLHLSLKGKGIVAGMPIVWVLDFRCVAELFIKAMGMDHLTEKIFYR